MPLLGAESELPHHDSLVEQGTPRKGTSRAADPVFDAPDLLADAVL
jgi:hypothetical protein